MIALGYYGAEVYDISMPFPTGPPGFAKSRATIRENPGKIGVLGATKRAEVELRAKWVGRPGRFRQFPFGVQCLLQHAWARIEVALVPPHEIAIQLVPYQFPPWEGHSFLAA